MKISYDPDVDALAIHLIHQKGIVQESDEIEEGVIVDYDADGKVVGVEALGFMAHLRASGQLPDTICVVSLEEVPIKS